MKLGDHLPATLALRDDFLGLFEAQQPLVVSLRTRCHLHVLRLSGGNQDLPTLYRILNQTTLRYVLSRRNAAAALGDVEKVVSAVNEVQAKFKAPDALNGEGGELLLYGFLEGHLGAPKVLTKMELKTSSNDYVKGADGLHIRQRDDDTFELIFGESKMYGDGKSGPGSSVDKALRAAFASMAKVASGGFTFDTWLVNSELLKEVADEVSLDVLRSILLPDPTAPTTKIHSFGVMIGFEVDVSDWDIENLSDDAVRLRLNDEAASLWASNVPLIQRLIAKYALRAMTSISIRCLSLSTLRPTNLGVSRPSE